MTKTIEAPPPLGHVLKSAHDMGREFRVLAALDGTSVPVPKAICRSDDQHIIGSDFYLMEFVDGMVYSRAEHLEGVTPDELTIIGESLVDTLVALHRIDPAEVGLANFGRPNGFLERQVRLWKRQLDASRTRTLDGADELYAALERSIPGSPPPSIIHGDYRLDNAMIDSLGVVAVLDWEMSTVGDPLTDLALLLLYRNRAPVIGEDPSDNIMLTEGFPSASAIVEQYASASEISLDRLPWYLGLAHLKMAAVLEGIYTRHTAGLTVGDGFASVGDMVQPLIDTGLRHLRAEAI